MVQEVSVSKGVKCVEFWNFQAGLRKLHRCPGGAVWKSSGRYLFAEAHLPLPPRRRCA